MRRGLATSVALLLFLGIFMVVRILELPLVVHVSQVLPVSIMSYTYGYLGGIFAGIIVALFVVLDILLRFGEFIPRTNPAGLPLYLALYLVYGFAAGLIFQNIQEKNRLLGRLRALHHAISILHSTSDMDEFYRATVKLVTTELGYLNAAIYLREQELVLKEAAIYAPGLKKGQVYACSRGYCTKAMDTGQSVIVSRKQDRDLCFLSNEGTAAQIIVPLQLYEKNIGVLLIETAKDTVINREEFAILEAFAQQIVVAMEKARLFDETKQLLEETRLLAETDGLTGLYNHRYFKQSLADELKRIKRMGGYVSVLMMDIDDFKKINDNCGHTVGDEVLVYVAKVIKESLREIDIVARYGGEEFAVILPGSDKEATIQVAERLRVTIESSVDINPSCNIDMVTVSMGLATYPLESEDWSSLIVLADKRLYEAKRLGKNRVIA